MAADSTVTGFCTGFKIPVQIHVDRVVDRVFQSQSRYRIARVPAFVHARTRRRGNKYSLYKESRGWCIGFFDSTTVSVYRAAFPTGRRYGKFEIAGTSVHVPERIPVDWSDTR
jgi:hypothetical protein